MARTHRSLYRLELWNRNSGMVADLSDITTRRSFTISLNRAEVLDLEFSLPVIEERAAKLKMTPQEMLAPGINEIHVWRGNRPIFGATVRYCLPTVGDTETLAVKATGYLDDFVHRYLWPQPNVNGGVTRYEDQDIGEIIMDMINTTQGLPYGDMGFEEGDIQPSRLLTDSWQPFATNLKDIFIAITERRNSVDFDFSYDRRLNVYYPHQGRDQSDLLFSYPGNIQRMSAPMDASQIVNVSINRGSGNGMDITPIRSRTDNPSLNVYGRMEKIDDYSDVSVEATLDSFGDETLRTFSKMLIIPDVTLKSREEPPLGAYWVGDWVRFAIPKRPSFSEVDGVRMRIYEISVSLNDLDTEEVRLTVANQ